MLDLEVSFLFCLCIIMVLLDLSNSTFMALFLSPKEQLFLALLGRAKTLNLSNSFSSF